MTKYGRLTKRFRSLYQRTVYGLLGYDVCGKESLNAIKKGAAGSEKKTVLEATVHKPHH